MFRVLPKSFILALFCQVSAGCSGEDNSAPDHQSLISIEQFGTASVGGNPSRIRVYLVTAQPASEAPRFRSASTEIFVKSASVETPIGSSCSNVDSTTVELDATLQFEGDAGFSLARTSICSVTMAPMNLPTPVFLRTIVGSLSGRSFQLDIGRQVRVAVVWTSGGPRTPEHDLFLEFDPAALLSGVTDADLNLLATSDGSIDDTRLPALARNLEAAVSVFEDTNDSGGLEADERQAVATIRISASR